jgi:predicted phage terminase large subunit-like protein
LLAIGAPGRNPALLAMLAEAQRAASTQSEPLSFRAWIATVNPRFQFYRHAELLIDILQDVADNKLGRLMVFVPPRHSKSETVSRLFSAYYLYRHPHRWVGLSSYGAELAYTLSRNARDNFVLGGGNLNQDSRGAKQWETLDGGGMWSAGVGGPITGKGFHLGIVDDPLKNAAESMSLTVREKHKEWWKSTFYTRAEPNAAIVIIQTRWHEDDLSGWLLSQETDEDGEGDGEGWTIVNMEAIKSEERRVFPVTCSLIPDDREVGEALCPERYAIERLLKIRKTIGSYFFGALYQQNPVPAEGNIILIKWLRFWVPAGSRLPAWTSRAGDEYVTHEQVELPSEFDSTIQSWDMSFKDSKTADFVCGQVWARKDADRFMLDQTLGRMNVVATMEAVHAMTEKWPEAATKIVEDTANGPAVISMLRRTVSGLIPYSPDKSKEARLYATQPEWEAGNIYLPHPALSPWVREYINRLIAFPNATHDDEVDATSQALLRLTLEVRRFAKAESRQG